MGNATHCCLDDLRVIDICGVVRTVDGVDAKPVGNSDDSA